MIAIQLATDEMNKQRLGKVCFCSAICIIQLIIAIISVVTWKFALLYRIIPHRVYTHVCVHTCVICPLLSLILMLWQMVDEYNGIVFILIVSTRFGKTVWTMAVDFWRFSIRGGLFAIFCPNARLWLVNFAFWWQVLVPTWPKHL